MNGVRSAGNHPDESLLRAELRKALGSYYDTQREIVNLECRPSEYRSSFSLDELDVELDDGTLLALVFKRVGWESLLEPARAVKPKFVHDPLREIETYR